MAKKLRLSGFDILGIALLLVLLVSVRLFQDNLFYDPLIVFFKKDTKILPQMDVMRLLLGLLFRYALNTAFSLGILWLVFKDWAIIRLSAILYSIFFILLIVAFVVTISMDSPHLLALFYVRRFLIQPIFLILFIPAFYYQKKA